VSKDSGRKACTHVSAVSEEGLHPSSL